MKRPKSDDPAVEASQVRDERAAWETNRRFALHNGIPAGTSTPSAVTKHVVFSDTSCPCSCAQFCEKCRTQRPAPDAA